MKLYDRAPPGATSRARSLRRNATDAERRLWRALRTALPACKWRRQAPIGPYVVDFLCFAERLVIELDGGQHAEAVASDARRTHFLEAQNYRVLRFWNNDVLGNTAGVLATIADALEPLSLRERGEDLRGTSPSLPLPTGEGKGWVREARLPYASSSKVTATSAFALRRTVSPSISAIRPLEI